MRDFILADNQDITRAGLETVLDRCGVASSVSVCAHTRSLTGLLSEVPCAAVILDYTLFDFYGEEQMLNLASRYDRTSWLLFSEELGRSFIRNVGVRDRFGIVMKGESLREIEAAIVATAEYRTYICDYARENHQGAGACNGRSGTPYRIGIVDTPRDSPREDHQGDCRRPVPQFPYNQQPP
ncbi:MAG: hypothetical protein LUD76_02165 [Alistipes sp.]|nr:hypothetical protein [Alistipes sp.]